jgi:hypothetical protein
MTISGRHITDHRMKRYIAARQTDAVAVAAALTTGLSGDPASCKKVGTGFLQKTRRQQESRARDLRQI